MNNFKNELKAEIAEEFQIDIKNLENYDVIIWDYTYISFEGDAFLLLQDKNSKKLYEVNGSHCSCYGLEGQFSLEEVTKKELIFRLENNQYYGLPTYYEHHSFREDLIDFLNDYVEVVE